jgi:phospholipase/carboxylesterase
MNVKVTRREFVATATGTFAAMTLGQACGLGLDAVSQRSGDGRLTARPKRGVKTTAAGSRALGLDPARDAILQLPANAGSAPLPLVVLLHGAGGGAAGILNRFGTIPSEAGVAVLAPTSRGPTWDAIRGVFGPDVAFLNRALEAVFDLVAVDPARVVAGGFSDGATYALSLGLINGDLFRKVLAFSPGFLVEGPLRGKPRIFMSHGVTDSVLPINRSSRMIAARLRQSDYNVTFREFPGGHDVPAAIAEEGLRWAAS